MERIWLFFGLFFGLFFVIDWPFSRQSLGVFTVFVIDLGLNFIDLSLEMLALIFIMLKRLNKRFFISLNSSQRLPEFIVSFLKILDFFFVIIGPIFKLKFLSPPFICLLIVNVSLVLEFISCFFKLAFH